MVTAGQGEGSHGGRRSVGSGRRRGGAAGWRPIGPAPLPVRCRPAPRRAAPPAPPPRARHWAPQHWRGRLQGPGLLLVAAGRWWGLPRPAGRAPARAADHATAQAAPELPRSPGCSVLCVPRRFKRPGQGRQQRLAPGAGAARDAPLHGTQGVQGAHRLRSHPQTRPNAMTGGTGAQSHRPGDRAPPSATAPPPMPPPLEQQGCDACRPDPLPAAHMCEASDITFILLHAYDN